jgi:cyclase
LCYGGNINSLNDARNIFEIGFEKIIINSNAYTNLNLIESIANEFGSQCLIGSIDVRKNFLGKRILYSHHGSIKRNISILDWVVSLENAGSGELLITSIDRDGMWSGYDIELIQLISDNVRIPTIANGGCGNRNHIFELFNNTNASACAVGSFVLYQKKDMGVLVNFPKDLVLNN